jgi:hypothetical protein
MAYVLSPAVFKEVAHLRSMMGSKYQQELAEGKTKMKWRSC